MIAIKIGFLKRKKKQQIWRWTVILLVPQGRRKKKQDEDNQAFLSRGITSDNLISYRWARSVPLRGNPIL